MDDKGKAIGVLVLLALATFATGAYAAFSPTESSADNSPGVNPVDEQANVTAFLAMIRSAESGGDYTALVGGGDFTDFSDHPANLGWPGIRRSDGRITTAAGAYQITRTTWNSYRTQFGVTDFSPQSQDQFAVGLLRMRRAYDYVAQGNFNQAMQMLRNEWESLAMILDGSYNISLADAQQIYVNNGGALA